MKAIIDNLLYNTENSDLIYSIRRKVLGAEVIYSPNRYYTVWHEVDIRRTKNGRYFEHNKDKEIITPTNEAAVKEILSRLDPEKYIELYGIVEEA